MHIGKSLLLNNAVIYLPDSVLIGGSILIEDGRIAGIFAAGDALPDNVAVQFDVEGRTLIPGFIDLHVHGGGGADAMGAATQPDAIERMSRYHASHGTTSFLPTTLTADHEPLLQAIRGIVQAMKSGTSGAEVLGIHMEGPYLNPKRCGAQDSRSMRIPSRKEIEQYLHAAEGALRLITLAPERDEMMELIRYLRDEMGVTVSIGHSDADSKTVRAAVEAGATHVTHLFNGMSPLHHREPGVAGSALMHDELAVELICDGVHLHPEIIRMVYKVKPHNRIVLVTDSIGAAGCPNGEYDLGSMPIVLKDGTARLRDGGNLAGSCLTMERALANTMAFTGIPLEDVLPGLTINPAKQIGVENRKGSIELGKDADLAVLDTDYAVVRTYVKGVCVFNRDEA